MTAEHVELTIPDCTHGAHRWRVTMFNRVNLFGLFPPIVVVVCRRCGVSVTGDVTLVTDPLLRGGRRRYAAHAAR